MSVMGLLHGPLPNIPGLSESCVWLHLPFIFLYHRKLLPFPLHHHPPPHPLKHQLKLQERQRLKHPPRPKPGAKQAGCKKPSLPALQHQAPLEKSLPMYPLLTPAAGGQDWF